MNGTKHASLFAALAAPFEPSEVKVRSHSGRQLHYITARTCMNRLDEVLGPENWWDAYRSGGENSIVCELTIRLPDGTIVTKCDAGGFAGMADSGDDDKSGYSDAFKRAAVKFGVSRYLYRDGVPSFVMNTAPNDMPVRVENVPRAVEASERPATIPIPSAAKAPGSVPPSMASLSSLKIPRTGRALFAWVKEAEKITMVGILKYLNDWAKIQSFPGRMVDWDADQTIVAYHEALRRLERAGESQAAAATATGTNGKH